MQRIVFSVSVYILRSTMFKKDYVIDYCRTKEEAEISAKSFISDTSILWTVNIRERILQYGEFLIITEENRGRIMMEWNLKTHKLHFSMQKKFCRTIFTLLGLGKVSIISCLPRDILFYIFSLLEEGSKEVR